MGYLICDKCGGYYALQYGEFPEDFSGKCDCGGKLIYSESLETSVKDFNDSITKITCLTVELKILETENFVNLVRDFLNPLKPHQILLESLKVLQENLLKIKQKNESK